MYMYTCVCVSCFSQVSTIHIIRALPSATSSSTALARFCQEESASWRTKRRTRGSSAMSARNFGGKSLERNMEKLWVQWEKQAAKYWTKMECESHCYLELTFLGGNDWDIMGVQARTWVLIYLDSNNNELGLNGALFMGI